MKRIMKELDDAIDNVERAYGDNEYDAGVLDTLYMVRNSIVKPKLRKKQGGEDKQ